jgi:hypothetical protein
MLPPPRVGGIEFSRSSVGPAPCWWATPIMPMNGRSGKRTRPPPITPWPFSTGVKTETLP